MSNAGSPNAQTAATPISQSGVEEFVIHLNGQKYDAELKIPDGDRQVTYPLDGIIDAKKPPLKVPGKSDVDVTKWLGPIESTKGAQEMDVEAAVGALASYALRLKGTLIGDWKSYGITIGKNGETITPLSLLDVSYTDKDVAGVSDPIKEEKVEGLIFYLLMVHRMSRLSDPRHIKEIVERANRHMTAFKGPEVDFNSFTSIHASFLLNEGYLKLVAAFDMFFNRFPRHPKMMLKFGTLGSRGKDCAVISSFYAIKEYFGMATGRDIAQWIMNHKVAKDLRRITKGGQEAGDEHSYFHYQVDMSLVIKSAYSAAVNPSLHLWLNTAGALGGMERAINAKAFNLDNFFDIAYAASLMVISHTSHADLQLFVTDKGKEAPPKVQVQDTAAQMEGSDLPRSKSAQEWLEYAATHQYKVFPVLRAFWEKVSARHIVVREKTIGEALEKSFPTWLSLQKK